MGESASPEAPLGLRERKKQELRDRLIDAARTLFDEKGFEATTTSRPSNTSFAKSQKRSSTIWARSSRKRASCVAPRPDAWPICSVAPARRRSERVRVTKSC
jgi:hypothetical protein